MSTTEHETPKLGDKVYVWQSGGFYETQYISAEVVKITPTGLVDLKIGHELIKRFRDGREYGNHYHGYRIDEDMSYSERAAFVEERNKVHRAIKTLRQCDVSLRYQAEREQVFVEISRIEALLQTAKDIFKE